MLAYVALVREQVRSAAPSAYVSIRQHTSAYVSIPVSVSYESRCALLLRMLTYADVC